MGGTFSYETSYKAHGSRSFKITSSTYTNVNIETMTIPLNHKIYVSMYRYIYNLTDGYYAFEIKSPNDKWPWATYAFATEKKWVHLSSIGTTQDTTNTYYMYIGNWSGSAATTMTDAVMVIDLTAAFGSSNEPSLAWCDSHINYFDGSTYIYK